MSVEPTLPSHPRRQPHPRRGLTAGLGAALGIATALVALGIAQLVAALFNSQVGGPVDAVGELFIDHTPPALKNFAIREFGSNDKTVLVWGIRAVLIIFAVVIGILALRRLWQGMIGLAVFIAVGVIASESQPTSRVSDVLPTLIGGLVAALFMRYLVRLADRGPAPWSARQPAGPPAWRLSQLAQPYGQPQPSQPDALSGPEAPGPSAAATGETGDAEEADAEEAAEAAEASQAGETDALSAGPVGPYIPQADVPGSGDVGPADGPLATGSGDAGPADQPPSVPGRQPAAAGAGEWSASWPPQPQPGSQPYSAESPDRRKFLLLSGAAAVGGLVVYGAGSWLSNTRDVSDIQKSLRLPRAATSAPSLPAGYDLKIPGLSSFITPNNNFYRVDTAIVLPEILPSSWQLRIHGMVARELTLSFDELIRRPLIEDYITLCCVSNPVGGPYIGNAKWLGASLRSLLQEAGIKAGADQLLATSSDGFTSGTPVQIAMDGRDALLAVAMNGAALPIEHGFPVRQVIPGLYGYVSACKWIVDIEVTTFAAAQAYWVPRGWSAQGPIKTESRIDVPGSGASIKAGTRTAIAGEAWAQHKGIEAVEVRIGNGPWNQAQLAAVPDLDTWRQWVYYWDAAVPPGNYLIEARATDKTGYTQTSLIEPEVPNGASGYPTASVSIT